MRTHGGHSGAGGLRKHGVPLTLLLSWGWPPAAWVPGLRRTHRVRTGVLQRAEVGGMHVHWLEREGEGEKEGDSDFKDWLTAL